MEVATDNLVLVLLGIGWIVLAAWLLFVTVSLKRMKNHQKFIAKVGENGDFIEAVNNNLKELASLKSGLEEIKTNQAKLEAALDTAIRRIGTVRFDAFDDVGGKLSFAVAFLNNRGDGVVISAINGRQESRSYAKLVKDGGSNFTLSIEERQAIAEALARDEVKV